MRKGVDQAMLIGTVGMEKQVSSSTHEADFPESPLRRLWGLGFSVIPVAHRTRHPLVAWSGFQTRLPTEAEITEWEATFPGSGVAIICGQVSKLVVLDVDPRNRGDESVKAYPALPKTVTTGGGGVHTYFRVDQALPTIHNLLPGVDLQAEGGLVFAPPTIHASGERYRWTGTCAGLPEWVAGLVEKSGARVAMGRGALALPPNSRPAPSFLSVLAGVRKDGSGWTAFCPVHEACPDGHTPSLRVWTWPDGNVGVKCWAGCQYRDIMQAVNWRVQAAS